MKFYIYFYLLIFIYDRHVQINNETALSFYKKFGFQIISTATEYYRRLEPCDAFLLGRSLKKTSLTEQVTSPTSLEQETSCGTFINCHRCGLIMNLISFILTHM